jgi:hypothetical protein
MRRPDGKGDTWDVSAPQRRPLPPPAREHAPFCRSHALARAVSVHAYSQPLPLSLRVRPPSTPAVRQINIRLWRRLHHLIPDPQLPKVVEGSRFNGGSLGENLRPAEVWSNFRWYRQPHVDW